jgi:beta-galactosidase
MRFLLLPVILAVLAASATVETAGAVGSPRERQLLDADWKFHLGDDWGTGEVLDKAGQSDGSAGLNFDDFGWRPVNLPHDWAVELPFDAQADRSHGFKALGPNYSTNSIAWYRRGFDLPEAERSKELWLEFDGVYRDCRVYLNGFLLAHQESGYNGFRCNISDVANCGGRNVLAVRVDATKFEGWFYEGAGIYRHVWLVETAPVAVAPDGIFVYSTFDHNPPGGDATIHLETQLRNSGTNAAAVKIKWQILDPDERTVAKAEAAAALPARAQKEVRRTARVASPLLWSPESPKLYRLVTTVESGGGVADREETEFGIRTVAFDPKNGFLLNGRPYAIQGTCNHQDHAGVGAALPDALQYFRVAKLKEMGCNAIRTSHNEPTAELLAACDHLGLLVMDENRRLGSDSQNLAYLRQQVCRDRNHACVFVWSLCNEEILQRTDVGARIFDTMQTAVHQLDPTRLCTAAMNSWSGGPADGFSTVMDVQGFNYLNNGDLDGFHRSNPAKPCIGTEEASAYYTRGIYENGATYDSAYDDNKTSYGATAEEWWKQYVARPWGSGSFVWTGFDYRGEPSPFNWPNISSEFGIIDTCGFQKDVFYYYQSWWTRQPVLHLMPHWNWAGREGQEIDVRAFSNCQEVELFLNGRSLGRQAMPRNSHLQWRVKYAPGVLSAKGYDHGALAAETKVETTGAPAAVRLSADRSTISADREDCSVVTVSVTDAQGRIVPLAHDPVHFTISGAGRIIGVGNGDPICHEPDVYIEPAAVRSMPLNEWRMAKVPEPNNRIETAAAFDDHGWQSVDTRQAAGPLEPHESAVFRVHVQLTADDLGSKEVVLHFGMIDDDGWVYVNGQFAGESHDWRLGPSFKVGKFLQAGDNVIAVAVKNNEATGGVNKGVVLDLARAPVPADWQRSVFNGLAEVIVQSGGAAGDLQLSARAQGLRPAVITIRTRAVGSAGDMAKP